MLKRTLQLFTFLMLIYSCTDKFDKNNFDKNFKNLKYKISDVSQLSSNDSEIFYINSDSTYTKITENSAKEISFTIGDISEINDSTFFNPTSLKNQNLFLNYNIKNSKNDDLRIQVLNKIGKPIEGLKIKFTTNQTQKIIATNQGNIYLKKNQYDSIIFPQLENITQRNHRLILPKDNDLTIILDLNKEIFINSDLNFKYNPDEIFVLFHPISDLFKN
ncbi:MAG: hypothetical protein KIG88_06190 [Weeksellaceae bacterium]|nr:hypothetical protein [Weeksellaceae bacterium]